MSKKKAFSGSTMTLKDFHGGSIPSDLPLPSAPGVIVRPSDRPGFDRQIPSAWGNPVGRSDHRSRPGSSGTTRNFDEKSSFLSHPAHIGRNFDEDERKPLDGVSVTRRTVSDESSIHIAPTRPESKPDSVSAGKFSGRPITSPVSRSPSAQPMRTSGSTAVGVIQQIQSGNSGQVVSVPNVWGTRKEAVGVSESVPSSAWSGPSAVSRFAQASALEKVSSGRWQSKHSMHHQIDAEVMRLVDTDSDFRPSKNNDSFSGVDQMNVMGDLDAMQGRCPERGRIVEDGTWFSGKEHLNYERARSPMYPEAKEKNSPFNQDGIRPASSEGKFDGSNMQPPVPAEVPERPKLKLLPRSKPLESSESPTVDFKQEYQQHVEIGRLDCVNEFNGKENPPKPGSAGGEGGNQTGERPKLNLKPRSQPLEQAEVRVERERKTLFGGARPRELVLKERGIDDVAINNLDMIQSPNRIKHELPKTETKPDLVVPTPRYSDRVENFPLDQKSVRDLERKDHRTDNEKLDMQRNSRRNEKWRSNRETEKQQDQRSEPETWRKPIEQPKSAPPDAPGLRYGKATSALELAQAFSRSVSDAKTADRFSGQRGLPGLNQIPFSRLTDKREFYSGATPRHQINGY